jgi:uncharacterized protein YlzI (FlbEa/FlbD family)
VIKVTLLTGGGTVYLNPQHIERIYATTTNPNNSVIVLTTGVPDVTVQESNTQVIYSIQADSRAGL